MKTIELTGTVDEKGGIALATPLPIEPATPLRVVVYYEENSAELSRQLKIAERVMREDANLLRELAK